MLTNKYCLKFISHNFTLQLYNKLNNGANLDSRKNKLIQDIQQLLNTYDNVNETSINPNLLEFMDENTLLSIVDTLLSQKEDAKESDIEWLQNFKKEIN